MTELTLVQTGATAARPKGRPAPGAGSDPLQNERALRESFDGCRADPFAGGSERRRRRLFRFSSSYGLSAFVGVVTYLAYGSLNSAWSNWALFAVAVYMFLSIPQLLVNLALLWVFVEGQVIDPKGLEGIGGFFATAAWITIVSQGGQYLANWLAQRHVGDADRNVVLAVSISAIVNALAVSGVTWIHPIYIALSLSFGAVIFGVGVVTDTRFLSKRSQP